MAVNNKLIENLDGSLTSVSTQDDKELKHIVDGNEKLKFATRHNTYKGDSQFSHRVARIPLIVVEQMMRDGVWNDPERMKAWLNDPANAAFRTTKGNV
jgi:hypothetical protein